MQLIAQKRLTTDNMTTLFQLSTRPTWKGVDITRLIVCNTGGESASFRLYFDNNGKNYSSGKELFWDEGSEIEAGGSFSDTLGGIGMRESAGSFGIKASRNNMLTVSLWGTPILQ